MQNDFTKGSVLKNIAIFSGPYLLSYLLQTLYGLADMFIVGQFNGSAVTAAVSSGSQVMHMVTVVVVGLAMGSTVIISRSLGAGEKKRVAKAIGNTVTLFIGVALLLTALLILFTKPIVNVMQTPQESVYQTTLYLIICFAGVPFIVAYNIISSIFRGLGDSKSPMYFIAIACITNVALDIVFIGVLDMKAAGAALGTVISQTLSVIIALIAIKVRKMGVKVSKGDLIPEKRMMGDILKIGLPVCAQDSFIQVSFLIITAIANSYGPDIAAAVGITEKIIGMLFLVPSTMLSTVSALCAQNVGAKLHHRAKKVLWYGVFITAGFGLLAAVVCQFTAEPLVGLFTNEPAVIEYGGQYLRSYVWDCLPAGIHFCFSGYFCAYAMSMVSFVHNVASIVLARIPGAYFAAKRFAPETLFPMGLASPLGSLVSVIICVGVYIFFQIRKSDRFTA
ncbi:MAG: MATE family efflux transporter [Clostridia bacterium]|nr:MATE family efflux transporter [Clostridia bacterium]